jgi:hypothetical protein
MAEMKISSLRTKSKLVSSIEKIIYGNTLKKCNFGVKEMHYDSCGKSLPP